MSKARAGWQNCKSQFTKTLGADWVSKTFKLDLGPDLDTIDKKCTDFKAEADTFLKNREKDEKRMDAMDDEWDKIREKQRQDHDNAYKKAKADAKAKKLPEPKEPSLDDSKSVAYYKKIKAAEAECQKAIAKELESLEKHASAIQDLDEKILKTLETYGEAVADRSKEKKISKGPWDMLVTTLWKSYADAHNANLKALAAKSGNLIYCVDLKKMTNYLLKQE